MRDALRAAALLTIPVARARLKDRARAAYAAGDRAGGDAISLTRDELARVVFRVWHPPLVQAEVWR